ncbi:MAG TPA: HAD family hydrolase [Allosphingosinicella sp.]|jgi:FMN phosphatase YigB (HAD superfamily)
MITELRPHQLPDALSAVHPDIALLSLDCFDTLLWRNMHAPRELFTALGAEGPTRLQRIWAEERARSRARLLRKSNEATLHEIYAALLPNADAETRARAAAAELEAEARHCYGFAPTVALIRAAKAQGLPIAIVSDTYLSADELGALIAAAAGEDVRALIDHVFASSDHGVSKGEGLFDRLLRDTGVAPERILHIGDNKRADFTAAREKGIQGIHLVQFDSATEQRLRLEAGLGAMLTPAGGTEAPNYQPHRAAIAIAAPQLDDEAAALGYATLGPVLHAFGRWVEAEAHALQAAGTRTHILFLMRDGHLPQRVYEALEPESGPGVPVEISRFTACAASFTDRPAVEAFLEVELQATAPEAIARQLLFTPGETAAMFRGVAPAAQPRALAKAVRDKKAMAKILARSAAFAERLCAYIRRMVHPAPGDTLMLVDLGYNGTVQELAEPLLRRAFGASVTGRYLLLREQRISGLDKKGLLDSRHYDASTLEALCGNVAVVEQLCTAATGSVVDYSPEGEPVRAGSSIKSRQSATREKVQEGCVRFARERDRAFVSPPRSDTADTQRSAAAAALARLMFLPLETELATLREFEHDINLGSDGTVALFDPAIAQTGLKRRGLFYMKGADRMYLPAELRGHGLSLSLSLFAQKRFGAGFLYSDFCDSGIDLPILVADGSQVVTDTVTAHPTHGGYYMAAIPVGESRFAIGLQFGRLYEWVQVDSVQFEPVAGFLSDQAARFAAPVDAIISMEGMEQVAPNLLRCESDSAFLMVPPPADSKGAMMLSVVFRPIAPRLPEPTPAPAATQTGAYA